ncbi:endonuclease/exonuclease/phosphatase family protein [Aestuariibius sp. 2305UL40-4]|uniref:endonuclease/exonuclease/phosphatase family protein n=1 Tax=Aestuariibius violaceus TaxID=3234132 RepID=UPI00345EAA57
MSIDAPKPLRLASYNIRAGLGTDLRRDPARVLHAIAGLSADLVVLQEADHRLGTRPSALPYGQISQLTGLAPLPISERPGGLGWHGIALLAQPTLVVSDIHRIPLPGLEPRGAVAADIEAEPGPLRVVGVHLGLLRSSRRAQLDRIREELDALDPRPTVILGDFNEWSTRKGLGRLARHYTLLTPGGTFPARLPLAPLDRIAHCDRLNVKLRPPPEARHPHPSDHRPILADVTLQPAA